MKKYIVGTYKNHMHAIFFTKYSSWVKCYLHSVHTIFYEWFSQLNGIFLLICLRFSETFPPLWIRHVNNNSKSTIARHDFDRSIIMRFVSLAWYANTCSSIIHDMQPTLTISRKVFLAPHSRDLIGLYLDTKPLGTSLTSMVSWTMPNSNKSNRIAWELLSW